MIAIDTSVAVAGLAGWHEGHRAAIEALSRRPVLPAHAAIEAYSVLTRFPPPYRFPRQIAIEYLDRVFPPEARLVPKPKTMKNLPRIASDLGIDRGQIYDALIGLAAKDAGATLVTRDVRAIPTYRALGVTFEVNG